MGTVFIGFERADRAVVLPNRIGLERQVDGSPALRVTLLRRDGQDTGGRLEVGFAVEADLAGIGARLAAAEVPARPTNVELAGEVLEVTVRIGAATADVRIQPLALDPDVLTRARVVTELSPAAATFAARLAADTTLPVSAMLRVLGSRRRTAALLADPAVTVEGDPGTVEAATRARVLRLRFGERIAAAALRGAAVSAASGGRGSLPR
ncbi:MAG: hypothetical protein ACRDTC_18755 [Pseudonocardiaceae bacterium]